MDVWRRGEPVRAVGPVVMDDPRFRVVQLVHVVYAERWTILDLK